MPLPLKQIRAIMMKSVGQVRRLRKNPRVGYAGAEAVARTATKKAGGLTARAKSFVESMTKNPSGIPLNPDVLHHIARENSIDVTNQLTAKGLMKALKRKQHYVSEGAKHNIPIIAKQRGIRAEKQEHLRSVLKRKVVKRTAITAGGVALGGAGSYAGYKKVRRTSR